PQLLSSVEPSLLRLTPLDARIHERFRGTFPGLRLQRLEPEQLKSEPAKAKWRPFCLAFEGLVEDFNFGTLLRLDARGAYTEENSILVPRIQFLAIEIARNREGCNQELHRRQRRAREARDPPESPRNSIKSEIPQ
uniref:protein PBDC1 n=1 Tax=Lonchura striata TaxID=40157 RepID=UPI000B4CC8B3